MLIQSRACCAARGYPWGISNTMWNNILSCHQVKELIAASLYVPEFLLKSQYMQQFAGKKYTVLTIPFEQVLTQEKAAATFG